MKFLERFQTLTAKPHQIGYDEYEPHPILKTYVHCFWFDHLLQSRSRVIPDLCMDVLIYIDEESNKVRSIFSGMNDTYFDTTTELASAVLGIRFFGWSGWLFSAEDLTSTKNIIGDSKDYFPMLTSLFQSEHFISVNPAQKIKLIENVLLNRIVEERKQLHPDFLNSMDLILQANDPITQKDLKRHCVIGARQLERLFRTYTGLSPKKMINLVRFQKIWRRMYATRTCDAADLVYQYGYVDQSHFIRDFKTFSGRTPKRMIQEI
ncbi:helix-turn-helix domain-containing protein [Halalkalibacter sp. AB-rgal2]|uniref:AraC family transcriptional regulator n=1 Tax=Halalkalibacter sp. AB-rgal2 TaxID=3242695 RepID=UPI00359D0511